MTRFAYEKHSFRFRGVLFSIFFFMIVCFLFSGAVSRFSEDTRLRQKEALESAIQQGVVYCYTLEGSYPQDLSYLKEAYGLHYDENLFFVDYRYQGANIYPDITIIDQGGTL